MAYHLIGHELSVSMGRGKRSKGANSLIAWVLDSQSYASYLQRSLHRAPYGCMVWRQRWPLRTSTTCKYQHLLQVAAVAVVLEPDQPHEQPLWPGVRSHPSSKSSGCDGFRPVPGTLSGNFLSNTKSQWSTLSRQDREPYRHADRHLCTKLKPGCDDVLEDPWYARKCNLSWKKTLPPRSRTPAKATTAHGCLLSSGQPPSGCPLSWPLQQLLKMLTYATFFGLWRAPGNPWRCSSCRRRCLHSARFPARLTWLNRSAPELTLAINSNKSQHIESAYICRGMQRKVSSASCRCVLAKPSCLTGRTCIYHLWSQNMQQCGRMSPNARMGAPP